MPTMYQLSARPGSPIHAVLGVMEALHAPDEAILEGIDGVVDPYRTPDVFVPWLTRWMGLEWLVADPDADAQQRGSASFEPGVGRLRDVVAVGHALAQWRGTEVALHLLLRAATGLDGFTVTEPSDRPFHLVVTAPDEGRAHETVMRRAIEAMKPAACTAELVFAPGSDAPTPEAHPVPEPPAPLDAPDAITLPDPTDVPDIDPTEENP
jgi:phage tail-like protein